MTQSVESWNEILSCSKKDSHRRSCSFSLFLYSPLSLFNSVKQKQRIGQCLTRPIILRLPTKGKLSYNSQTEYTGKAYILKHLNQIVVARQISGRWTGYRPQDISEFKISSLLFDITLLRFQPPSVVGTKLGWHKCNNWQGFSSRQGNSLELSN